MSHCGPKFSTLIACSPKTLRTRAIEYIFDIMEVVHLTTEYRNCSQNEFDDFENHSSTVVYEQSFSMETNHDLPNMVIRIISRWFKV